MPPRNPHESDRTVDNIIRQGTITQHKSKSGKMLAKVDIHGRETDWLPVSSIANSFMKVWFPLRAGEQVAVHSEFGNADSGVVHRSLFNDDCPEPAGADNDTAVIEFHDGASFSYNTKTGVLSITAINEAKIAAPHIELSCETGHSSGSWEIDGSIHVGEDITTDGSVTDGEGDLTHFTTTDGASRA